jgi:hypothetical protein
MDSICVIARSSPQACADAGWSDDALHNFFGRWVDGSGVDGNDTCTARHGQFLAKIGYLPKY